MNINRIIQEEIEKHFGDKMLGYKVMRFEDGKLVSGRNSRLNFEPKVGATLKMPGNGMYISPKKEYVLDYYSGLADNEVLLTLEFDPKDVRLGWETRADSEPEFTVSKAIIKDIDKVEEGEIVEIDLPNSLVFNPSPPLTRSGAQTGRTAYPQDKQIQQMIDKAGLTPIGMNEEEAAMMGPLTAFKGRGRSGSVELKNQPKFGKGLYFTPQIDIAKEYSDKIFKYTLEPKKVYQTPKFKKLMDYQIWSFKLSKQFGGKKEWIDKLKSDGYDMVMGWNPAFNEWEYVVLDKNIITNEEQVDIPVPKNKFISTGFDLKRNPEGALDEDSKKKEITTLSFFDFDGTLADAMEPGEGKKEYKKVTGKNYPDIGWWDNPKSLEPFDVKIFPKIKAEYEKKKAIPQSKTFLLTNRVEKLSKQVKSILDDGGVTMDGYDFYQSGKNKADRIKAIMKKFPKVTTINIYDDRADQLNIFKAFKSEMDHNFVDVNVHRCTKGNFKSTK